MKTILAFALLIVVLTLTNAEKSKPRIIGGQPARAAQFPFAAAIHVRTASYTMFCGGTIISTQFILTAGQCVKDAIQFTIQLGSNHLEGDDPNRVTVSSSNYILHPEYNPVTLENDIGLIKLNLPITLTNYIMVAELGKAAVDEGIKATAIGWGQTSDDVAGTSNELQYVQLSALSNTECSLIYGDQLTDNMVCLSGNYNEGACIEDTGSPLVTSFLLWNWVIAISSFVSGNGCESTDPSGYTRLSPYHDWIDNVTGIVDNY